MNYGYKCVGWTKQEKELLALALMNDLNIHGDGSDGISPYVEVDSAYEGVRIRKITHLSEKEHKELVEKADKIFKEMEAEQLNKGVNKEFKKLLIRSKELGFH